MVAATAIQASALGSPAFSGEYRVNVYGDSFSDSGGGTGWIGESLGVQTSQGFTYREVATGGHTVAQIRVAFEADFPPPGNTIHLQGALNSIRTDVPLSSIQTDWAAMLDLAIAHGGYTLIAVNQSPWMGHAEWTDARQLVTEQFNAWLLATYPEHAKDVYTALGDPAESRQLADEFYKVARTDAHPSRNGDAVIDDNSGESLFFANDAVTRDADGGNVHPFPNAPGSWANVLRATIGGNLIRMCDGTYSNVNGVVPSSDAISHVARHAFSATTDNISVVAKALVKLGNHQWVKFEYKDNAGNINMNYFDLLNVAVGATGTGAFTPAIVKASRGWVEVSLTGNTGVGGGTNWINLNPAEANGDENFTGDVRTPSIYVDRVQLVPT